MTPRTDHPLVRVVGLRLHAGETTVVDGVTFTLRAGESAAIVGASGSGKSTTALALLGHLRDGVRHTGGEVEVAGRSMLPVPSPDLRGGTVAYLGQDPGTALNPYRRISATLLTARGGVPIARRRRTVADLLTRVALPPELGDRYPHQLSGGQQQRAARAVALARDPRLLILDEPTSALDAAAGAEVRRELLSLREEGVSLLWITHDLAAVRGAVDRVLVFDAGTLVEDRPRDHLSAGCATAPARALAGASAPIRRPPRPASAASPLLTVRNLVAGHPDGPPVLRDVSLDVFSGRCLAVLGASGAGKSTLARCLAGLHRQSAGTVRLDGSVLAPDVRDRTSGQRAAVQLVAQDPAGALHPRQRVRTALARPMRLLRGVRDRHVLEAETVRLLRAVRLPPEYAGRLPGELSGGERQRVVLARALAAGPRLLICDEVTAALDTVARRAMADLLTGLARDLDMAIVFITHDTAAARHLADEVMVLADGGIGGYGPGADLPVPGQDPPDRHREQDRPVDGRCRT
ncbi:ABC transporter ATP-binding protein [Planomonospora algeriensis]